MTAITKTWTNIADASIDPDAPLLSSLMYAIRDNAVHNYEWIGKNYTPVQDHNHDGVNSALIQIGANMLRNGSFESDTAGFTTTAYTGGTVAVNTANAMDGEKCLAFTSTVLANGGGYADSDEFIPVSAGEVYSFRALRKASVANISSRLVVLWYDAAKASISNTTLADTTNTSTARSDVGGDVVSPTSARYMKLRVVGGVPGAGSATGTVYFDRLFVSRGLTQIFPGNSDITDLISNNVTGTTLTEIFNYRIMATGTYRVSQGISVDTVGFPGNTYIYRNGASTGVSHTGINTTSPTYVTDDVYFEEGDTMQIFANNSYAGHVTTVLSRFQADAAGANMIPPSRIIVGSR